VPVARQLLALPAVRLAPRLLGAVVVSRVDGVEVAIRLTEVEAYEGVDDPASHAFRGQTRRTAVMFGPPGHLYCYFTHGMHWCANITCDVDGRASAVLLRAGEVISGLDVAHTRRPTARSTSDLARGPARLSSCLALGAAQNGVDLCDPASPVVLDSMLRRRAAGALSGPRVGISSAQEHPWRFWLAGDRTVSSFRAGSRTRAAGDRQTDNRD
jgi:DNA-3-methyladenine glycosylase